MLWSGSTEAFLHQSYNISCFAAGYPLPNLTVDTSPEQCSYNLNYLTIDLYTRGVTILVGNVTSCWHTALLHCYVSDPGAQSVQGIIRLNVKGTHYTCNIKPVCTSVGGFQVEEVFNITARGRSRLLETSIQPSFKSKI